MRGTCVPSPSAYITSQLPSDPSGLSTPHSPSCPYSSKSRVAGTARKNASRHVFTACGKSRSRGRPGIYPKQQRRRMGAGFWPLRCAFGHFRLKSGLFQAAPTDCGRTIGSRKTRQGTTLVVPQKLKKRVGFSPCGEVPVFLNSSPPPTHSPPYTPPESLR